MPAVASADRPGRVAEPTTWPPPMRVGLGLSLVEQTPHRVVRRAWCDFGARNARLEPLPLQDDPVFRTLSAAAKQRLQQTTTWLRDRNPGSRIGADDRASLHALAKGPEGLAITRSLLGHKDTRVVGAAIEMARSVIAKAPRLAGSIFSAMHQATPEVSTAAVRTLMAARCDTPAMYAMDGLAHRDPAVRRATIEEVFLAAEAWADIGLVGQVLAHVEKHEKEPLLRALVARAVGEFGWLAAQTTLRRLVRDRDRRVRNEARVAMATIVRSPDPRPIVGGLRHRDVNTRAAAIRAAALAFRLRPLRGLALLRPLLGDRRKVKDPLGVSPATTITAMAQRAITYLEAPGAPSPADNVGAR